MENQVEQPDQDGALFSTDAFAIATLLKVTPLPTEISRIHEHQIQNSMEN